MDKIDKKLDEKIEKLRLGSNIVTAVHENYGNIPWTKYLHDAK